MLRVIGWDLCHFSNLSNTGLGKTSLSGVFSVMQLTHVCVCVYKDKAVIVTPTQEVLTLVCSDILRRIQALQSQSTYCALGSLSYWD